MATNDRRRRVQHWGPTIVLLLLALYAGVLFARRVRVAGGSDTSGYLNQARMWTRGDLSIPQEMWRELRLPADYVHSFPPLGFAAARQLGAMVPTYPIGTPLHLAILRTLGGDAAMFLIGPLSALTALVLLFLLARRVGLPRGYACAAAAVLAVCPVFVFNALYPVSDILAVVWAVAAVLAAYRAGESWRWGFLAGAAIGIGVLIRPSQLMLLPAIAMATRLRPKPLLAILAGGLPFAFIQLGLANHFYGSPFRTGYGDADSLFHFANLPARLGDYGYWLARLLPLVFPLGLAALFLKRIDRTTRAVLGAWFLSFLFFYCFYDVFGEWGATRFLLPAMPAVILLFLLGIRELLGERHRIAAAIIALILAAELIQGRSFGVLGPAQGDEIYRLSVTEARKLMNARSLVIGTEMTGAYLYYNGETMIRLDSLHPDRFETLRAYASIAGRKWYALVPYFEETDLKARAPGTWFPIAKFRDVTLFELQSH